MFIERMRPPVTIAALILAVGFPALPRAQNIDGTILIKKRLTRRSVTAPVSIYQRGNVVGLGKDVESGQDSEEDPLALERSRVVIWVEGPGPAIPVARIPIIATMTQRGRRFVPDLLVIPVGSTVSFPNDDPIFHNVFSLSQPKAFDLGNYIKGESRRVTFAREGIVFVDCHLHPNMAGAIVVTPNRWYAKADRTGRYALRDLPPGQYTIVAWHKAAGFFRKSIQLSTGRDATVDFFIPIGAEAK